MCTCRTLTLWVFTAPSMVSVAHLFPLHLLPYRNVMCLNLQPSACRHGYPNTTFAILSDKAHQLNARFDTVAVVGGTSMQSIGLKHGRDEVEVSTACISGLGMLSGMADEGNGCWQLLTWPSCLRHSTCTTCVGRPTACKQA